MWSRTRTRGLVLLVVACLLRAMLPAELSSGREHFFGGDFRCKDHACGCASSEACRRACCCESAGTSRPVAERSSVPLLRALECHGFGAGGLATQPSGWIAVLPAPIEWSVERPSWSAERSPPDSCRGRDPEPATPPPRAVERVS